MRKVFLFIAALALGVGLWAAVPANVESVDLGLPSGLKWANMNVGATSPADYGDYFAWGETKPKKNYSWSTYLLGSGSWSSLTRYTCPDGQTSCIWYNGGTFVGDNKTTLDPEDDAARVNWGADWRMPTKNEIEELIGNCTWQWTNNYNNTGVKGYVVTGKKGKKAGYTDNSIFLPASGYYEGESLEGPGTFGDYWSSSLYGYSDAAYRIYFGGSDPQGCDGVDRYNGCSVRPVFKSIVPTALPTPASNQIYYRSSDHQKITLNNPNYFGVTYNDAQSTYNSQDDYGVITFDGDVTSIGGWAFSNCTTLTAIVWPSTVTSVGAEAFLNCTNLSIIDLQEGMTSIGDYAFSGCAGVSELFIPSTVSVIGKYAFNGCFNLTKLTVKAGSIGEDAFLNCTNLSSIDLQEGVTNIGDDAFNGCAGTTELTIPSTVTSIGNYAFLGWQNLTKLTVKAGSIGLEAFYGCTNLSTIDLQEGVTSIGVRAFDGCTGIVELTIPSTMTSIGDYAFRSCKSMTKLTIKAGSIGDYAFQNCANLSTIDLQEGVTSIGDFAFNGCFNLTKLTVKAGSIGGHAFNGCTNLSHLDLQEGVTSIGVHAFDGCTGIVELTIPSTMTSIGDYAFQSCKSMTKLTIEAGNIGQFAFSGCIGVTELTILSTVTNIGKSAFLNCTNLASITFENGVAGIGNDAFSGCTNVASVKFLGYVVLDGGSLNSIGTAESPADLQIPSAWLANDKPVNSTTPWHGGYFNCTYEKTASELLGAMAEPCVGCTAVKVSDGETTVILYAPKTIEYIKAVTE